MEKTEAHRLPRVVLNERRRRAVKMRLNGATIAETVAQCELGRSAVIRAMQAYEHMKRFAHGREKRVFLILDNLRVHHSKAVKQWLSENEKKIAVFYLPSYSPELNPDELLNADLKQRVSKVAPARNKNALTRTAIGALRGIQKQPERVECYFGHKDVCYAAA